MNQLNEVKTLGIKFDWFYF